MRVWFYGAEGPLLSKPGLAHLCVVTRAGNWEILSPRDAGGAAGGRRSSLGVAWDVMHSAVGTVRAWVSICENFLHWLVASPQPPPRRACSPRHSCDGISNPWLPADKDDEVGRMLTVASSGWGSAGCSPLRSERRGSRSG